MSISQNVDPLEIEKFESIASKWWDKTGDFKPLHEINPIRLDFVMQQCNGIFEKETIDVGCGGGILAESMARHGAKVTGIDMGKEPLAVAKLHALEAEVTLTYKQCTAEEQAEAHPQQYDLVTCMEMLEHVPDPQSVITALAKMVKRDGDVFISTLNRNMKSYLFAIVGAEQVLNLVPKGTHDHSKFIRPSELIDWCEQAGLKAVKMTGLTYNPLSGIYKRTDDVDVNYIVHLQPADRA